MASVGVGIWIDTSAAHLVKPLTVEFDNLPSGRDGTVFAAHLSDRGDWNLVEAERTPTKLIVGTNRFSVLTWIGSHIFDPIRDYLVEKLSGRTTPVSCIPKPSWADATPPPSGSTHACVRAGGTATDGSAVAELDLKSNRGTYQWVAMPSTLRSEYTWVEEQPDFIRAIVARLVKSSAVILLPPGKRMTIGYPQPDLPTQLKYATYPSPSAQALSIVKWTLDFLVGSDDTVNALGALYCANVVRINLSPTGGSVNVSWPSVSRRIVECIVARVTEWGDDPSKAAAAAGELLGYPVANSDQLTALTEHLYAAGNRAAIFSKIVSLGAVAIQQLTYVLDSVVAGFGTENASEAVLTLAGKPNQRSAASCTAAALAQALARIDREAGRTQFVGQNGVYKHYCTRGWAEVVTYQLGHPMGNEGGFLRDVGGVWQWAQGGDPEEVPRYPVPHDILNELIAGIEATPTIDHATY